jgi:TolB-like protein/Tfp pilus assembly protein PilF
LAGSFFQELKRRNVFRVAIVYVVVSWLLMQIGDVMFPALRLPDWTPTLLVAFLILGFPLVVVFAWAFELTPDGVTRTKEVPEDQSITADTGRKINYMIIGILAVAVVFLLVKDLLLQDGPAPPTVEVSDRSIAVLPFKNQSASAENAEFFAGGLHDELLTLLSKLEDLKVISRTSVERLGPDLTIPEIGILLGVATVLEGQVQRAGNRLRINVQLIDTAAEGHLWANTYDSELTAENVFDVQSDIARTIANALQAELSPSDVAALQTVPTTSTAALEKYLLAMQVAKRRSYDALRQAEAYLVEVTDMDASFAAAWVGLAEIRGELFMTGAIGLQRYLDDAGLAVQRALELDPRSAGALAERARVMTAGGQAELAEQSFRTALQTEPHNSNVHDNYGEWLRMRGRLEEARTILEAGLEYDPLSPNLLFQLGRVEMYLGNPEGNIEIGRKILEIDPSVVYGYVAQLQGNLWRGDFDEAWPWYVKTVAADPEDYETWAHMALFLDDLDFPDYADRYLARATSLDADAPVVIKCTTMILSNRGRTDEAIALAAKSLDAGIDDRWESDRVLLRAVRDKALDSGNLEAAVEHYRQRASSLFAVAPVVTEQNINKVADLALLLQAAGDSARAERLLSSARSWYARTQPPGVYGYIHGLVLAELQAVAGEDDAALTTLQQAIGNGYRWQWKWALANKNFDGIRSHPSFQQLVRELQADIAQSRVDLEAIPDQGEFDLRDAPLK